MTIAGVASKAASMALQELPRPVKRGVLLVGVGALLGIWVLNTTSAEAAQDGRLGSVETDVAALMEHAAETDDRLEEGARADSAIIRGLELMVCLQDAEAGRIRPSACNSFR